jgi:tetratricopeptide (TPR) repeat protein
LHPGITGEDADLFDAQVLLASGKPQEALAQMDRAKAPARKGVGSLVSREALLRALAYDNLGRKDEANAQLAEMETHHSKDMPFAIALVYANRGKMAEAFGWFDYAYRLRDNGLAYLKVDPLVKNVQLDPRFNQLLNKLGLKD